MRVLLIGALSLTVAFQASAQSSVAIRSGEHATFTRLVIDTRPPEGWSASREDHIVNIALPEIGPLATNKVFDLIPRTRLLGLEVEESEVLLRLGCNCPVQVFELGTRALVIDIRDPQSTPATSAADISTPPEVEMIAEVIPDVSELTAPAADLSAVRLRLIEQLTRAADQGLLSMADSSSVEPTVSEAVVEPSAKVDEVVSVTPPAPADPMPTIDIRTAFEDATESNPAAITSCEFPNPIVDGSEQDRYQTYVSLRSQIYAEFDTVNPAKLRQMLLTALGLGLGYEVQAHLKSHPGVIPEEAVLMDMARLTAGLPTGTALQRFSECNGVAGLWGRLVTATPELATRFASSDIEVLASLPPAHRVMLAEHTAKHWLTLAMPATAQQAVDLAQRSGLSFPPALQLVAAQISQSRGNYDAARAQFSALSSNSGLSGIQARIGLIEISILQGETVAPVAELELAASAFQMRGTQIGRDAIRLLASIRATDGDLSQSLQLLADSIRQEPEMAPIWQRVAADLVQGTPANSPDYARAILQHIDLLPDGSTGDDARAAAADGLLSLGLPTDAMAIAMPAANRGNALAQSIIQSAIEHLEGVHSIEVSTPSTDSPQNRIRPRVPGTLATAEQLIESGRALRISTAELISAGSN